MKNTIAFLMIWSLTSVTFCADELKFPANGYRKPSPAAKATKIDRTTPIGLDAKGMSVGDGISFVFGTPGKTIQDGDGDPTEPYLGRMQKWLRAGLFDLAIRNTESYFARNIVEEANPWGKNEIARAYIEVGRYKDAFRVLQPFLKESMQDLNYTASLATALNGKIYPDQEAYIEEEWKDRFPDFEVPPIASQRSRIIYMSCLLSSIDTFCYGAPNYAVLKRALDIWPGDPLATYRFAIETWRTKGIDQAQKVLETANKTDHYESNFLLNDLRGVLEIRKAQR
jgi:hypothetical protein